MPLACDRDLTAAVFSNGDNFVLVRLEADADESAAASAVAQGYSYSGCIAVVGGVPRVQCEPGFEGVFSHAGILFAEMLGVHLKQQLEQTRSQGEKAGC